MPLPGLRQALLARLQLALAHAHAHGRAAVRVHVPGVRQALRAGVQSEDAHEEPRCGGGRARAGGYEPGAGLFARGHESRWRGDDGWSGAVDDAAGRVDAVWMSERNNTSDTGRVRAVSSTLIAGRQSASRWRKKGAWRSQTLTSAAHDHVRARNGSTLQTPGRL